MIRPIAVQLVGKIDEAGTFRFRVLSRDDPTGGGIVSNRIRVGP